MQHVIIVGAGPVGLVTANLLVDAGISVSLVEACEDLPRDLRASTFHPPTLDMLERFGVVGRDDRAGADLPDLAVPRPQRRRHRNVRTGAAFARHQPSLSPAMRAVAARRMLYARLKESPLATVRLGTKAARCAADRRRRGARRPTAGRRQRDHSRHVPGRRRRHRQRRAQGDRRSVRRNHDPRAVPDAVDDLRLPRRRCPISRTSPTCPIRRNGTC